MTNYNVTSLADINNKQNQLKQLDDHIIYYDESLNDVQKEIKKLNYPDAIIKKYDDLYVAFDN